MIRVNNMIRDNIKHCRKEADEEANPLVTPVQCPQKLFATNILCETVYSDLVCNLDCKLFKFLSLSVSRPSSD